MLLGEVYTMLCEMTVLAKTRPLQSYISPRGALTYCLIDV